MLSGRLAKYFKSYVIIKLNGSNIEKILNLLRKKHIIVWDIVKTEEGIKFKTSKKDYENNKKFLDEINMKPQKKVGFMYSLSKLSVRIGFIVGAILIFIYLAIYSSFIWEIKVIGYETIDKNELISAVEESGNKLPMAIGKVDKKDIENSLYRKFDKLKFVEAYIEGVKLVIFVKEKKEIEYEKIDKTPSSIVASKQAVIYKTVVKQGELMVKEGDVVSKGQLLVQGVKKINDNENVLINSDAQILGYTYYNITLKEPKIHTTYKETGEINTIKYLMLNGKEIKLWGNKDKYQYKSEIDNIAKVPIITDFLHISFKTVKQYELRAESEIISSEYASSKLKIDIYENLKKNINYNSCKLVKEEINLSEDNESYIMNAKIQLLEDIGSYIKIYDIPNTYNEGNT